MPLVPSLQQPTDCLGDPSSGQLIGYKFYVGVEFGLCTFVVFTGILSLVRRHRKIGFAFDFLSSAYLLWATYTRQFYLHYTPVSQFASDVCAAFTGDKSLTYNYLVVTIASWIASTFLEYKGVLFLKRLYSTKLRRPSYRLPCLSHGRMVVLATAAFCTINSVCLTLLFWGAVQKSLENVTFGVSVWAFLTVAALMKLTHQLMEGFTFIIGIAVRDFKWRTSNSDKLFGQIAYSSFILLVYSSVLTYAFTNQEAKVWSAERCVIFVAICTDILFRLVVFTWASYNSCCFSRITDFLSKSQALVMDLVLFQRRILLSIVAFLKRLCLFIITFCYTCLAHLLHWLGNIWPPQVQLETDIDYTRDELVCPPMDIQYLTRNHILTHCSDDLREWEAIPRREYTVASPLLLTQTYSKSSLIVPPPLTVALPPQSEIVAQ